MPERKTTVTVCNEEVVAELVAHGVDSDEDSKRYVQLMEVATPYLEHKLSQVVVHCADCSFDGGRSCPTGAAQAVYDVASEKNVAWPVFGWMWSANGTDLPYQ